MTGCNKKELASDGGGVPLSNDFALKPGSTVVIDSTVHIDERVSAEFERARLLQMQLHTDFEATGFFLQEGGTVTLNVTAEVGSRMPTLIIGTLSRYVIFGDAADGNLTYVKLQPGENVIKDTKGLGGLMFLQFVNSYPQYSTLGRVKVEFKNGMMPLPYFKLGKTTNSQWLEMLSAFNNAPSVLLETNKTMMVVSFKNAYRYQKEDVETVLKKMDMVFETEDRLSGLDGETLRDQLPKHKILITEMDLGPSSDRNYMFTWTKRIAFHADYANKFITMNGLTTSAGWSVWHEAGHMHQQAAWTWSTVKETTVNVYALAVQRAFGVNPNEIVSRNVWGNAISYLAGGDKDFNKNYSNFDENSMNWVRVCMFQQLWLQYGDDFYIKLHKKVRRENPAVSSDAQKMSYFMLSASQITGNDLTSFFRKWGFNLSAAEYAKVTALNLPAPSRDLTALRD